MLDAKIVPEFYRVLLSDDQSSLERIRGTEISLSGIMSLSLLHQAYILSGDHARAQYISNLSISSVNQAICYLQRENKNYSIDPFGAPNAELYRIDNQSDIASEEWVLFYDRFRRSAANRKKSDMFRSVGGVLGEMGDNVPSHAYIQSDIPCLAMAGFHVCNGTASFCVCDLGQGFLASLRRNAIWQNLRTDYDALDAVVNRRATSRPDEKEGGGFKHLFNMLLDFNGLVIIRTGGCIFQLVNEGHVRRLEIRSTTHVPGSAITVVISKCSKPKEIALEVFS